MINVYFGGAIPFHSVDLFLQPDGICYSNPFSTNIEKELNMAVLGDDLGITPQQMDMLIWYAKTYKLVFHMSVN